jgi:hypothetical protein
MQYIELKLYDMKTLTLLVSSLLMFMLAGCGGKEVRYYTRINPDGSIFKRVVIAGDSATVYKNPFAFDVTDGWSVSYDIEIGEDDKDTVHLVMAEKIFQNADIAHASFYRELDTLEHENIRIEHVSKYRWFYTFHSYKEVFEQKFPFKHVTLTDFLTEDERAYFLEEDTTVLEGLSKEEIKQFEDQGDEKWMDFLFTSLSMEFQLLLQQYADKQGFAISEAQKESIHNYIMSEQDDLPDFRHLCTIADSIVGAGWVKAAYDENYFSRFEEQCEDDLITLNADDFIAEIEVPGVLYQSNGHTLEGNKVQWRFEGDQFQYQDLVLEVNYRTTNTWAFILTGCFILIFFTGLLYLRRK